MHYGWPSPSLPVLQNADNSIFPINNNEGFWLAVMPTLSATIGAPFVIALVDIMGRKTFIIGSFIPLFSAWIMIAFCNSLLQLYIARFIAGIADSWSFTSVSMYICEIAHPKIRGLLGSGVSIGSILGHLLINIFGSYLSIENTAIVSSAIPIVGFLIFIWMPESPYYLLMRNQVDKAKQQLQILRGLENVQIELDKIHNGIKEQIKNTGKVLDLFKKRSNRKALVIIAVLRGVQQLSGSAAILFYTQSIFKESGNQVSSKVATIIYYSVQLVVTFISGGMVDIAGRRSLLILSVSGSAVALFCEATYFYVKTKTSIDISSLSYLSIVFLLAFVIFFSLGMQSIPVLMLGEIFPANVKAFALSLSDVYFYLLTSVVCKFFQYTKDNVGIFLPFYGFSGVCFFGLIFIFFVVPETKGKTLEEIQENLEGKLIQM